MDTASRRLSVLSTQLTAHAADASGHNLGSRIFEGKVAIITGTLTLLHAAAARELGLQQHCR
eukprot:1157773-Pelagomonas_calceolata.AAC.1